MAREARCRRMSENEDNDTGLKDSISTIALFPLTII